MFIPLYYQLVSAYHPISDYQTNVVVATPSPSVLGVSTTSPAIPTNVGGEGKMITIAVLGDSMIQTLGPDMLPLKKSLQKYFPEHAFYLANFGQSATTIDKAANKLPDIIALKPDIVVVESFAYNNFGNTQSGYDLQWQNLSNITSKIKASLPNTKIVLSTTIAPNSVTFANGVKDMNLSALDKVERTKTIKLYLQNLVKFATSQGFPLANAYQSSLVHNEGNPQLISSTDFLHPSESGKNFFSEILASTLSQNKLVN